MKPLEKIDLYQSKIMEIIEWDFQNKEKMLAFFDRAIQVAEREYINSLT